MWSKLYKIPAFALIILILCFSSYAILMGRGEVTGVVEQSWYAGERVVFRLRISSQTNDEGPQLGNPNFFVYNGADKAQITEGDQLKLRYDSDDDDGIIVESLEFIDNKPGEIKKSVNIPTGFIIGGMLFGITLLLAVLFYAIRKKRRENV